jgi:hypothetical protein
MYGVIVNQSESANACPAKLLCSVSANTPKSDNKDMCVLQSAYILAANQ